MPPSNLNNRPILIAGPTASGKSSLGVRMAKKYNGIIINADALQVYKEWHILTARPSHQDMADIPHTLYGYVPVLSSYSVGHWIKAVSLALKKAHENNQRPIILGGTGLYFKALCEGIADIPPIKPEIKIQADKLKLESFGQELYEIDPKTYGRLDRQNPMRTRRAWEVFKSTGRPLADWQDDTPPPLLPLQNCTAYILKCNTQWLNTRIRTRFHQMIECGAIEECKDILAKNKWRPEHPSCKAIGASALIDYIKGNMTLNDAIEQATVQTMRYAKRQRTWFRSHMKNWREIQPEHPDYINITD